MLKWLRSSHFKVPVLVLTARDTVSDRVSGLNAGADDYLIKPFDLDELIARLNALLRRSAGLVTMTIQHSDIVLTPSTHHVSKDGQTIELSAREF
ncbi:MAG: response regulator, partial [Methylotenera sp.]